MSDLNFIRFWGDNAVLTAALVHPDTGNTFDPTGHSLLFTVKRSLGQTDAEALIQKLSTVGGIAASPGSAAVSLVPADWALLRADLVYYYSIKAINVTTGAGLTVARGRLSGQAVAGRGSSLSIPTTIITPAADLGFAMRALDDVADLADLAIADFPVPYIVGVSVGDENISWWRLRAKVDGEVTDNAETIVSTVDDTKVFFRVG